MTSSTFHAVAAGIVGVVVGGVFAQFVTNVLGLVVLVTGITTATLRYLAIYQRRGETEVERQTALGFVVGLYLSAAIIAIDAVVS